jgi:hypothetical protein
MNPLIQHLTEELQAIIKALDEDNPGRAHWLARTAIAHIEKQAAAASCLNSDTPTERTFTAWCCQAGGGGTIHISSFEATDLDHAIQTGMQTCMEDWQEENPANIHLLGIAQGDVEILYWKDPDQ